MFLIDILINKLKFGLHMDVEEIKLLLRRALARKTCIDYSVASVIVTPDDDYVLGWNGPTKGMQHTRCFMKKVPGLEDLYLCTGAHAERYAISDAADKGMSTRDSEMYLSGWFPCKDCAISIVKAGISKFTTPDLFYSNAKEHTLVRALQNTPYNFEAAEEIMRRGGVELLVDPKIRP